MLSLLVEGKRSRKLCSIALLICLAACSTNDSKLAAITDQTLSLGLVRVDESGKKFNLLLCAQQKTYSHTDLAENCVPALLDAEGKAAIIPHDFPRMRSRLAIDGTIKLAISVAVLAVAGYMVGKKIRKVAARIRHKNLDMNSMSSLQKLKLEADNNLYQTRMHLDSVQERFSQVKALRNEHYFNNGLPPNNRRFIPLFRTTDYKAYSSLEKATLKAKKTLVAAEQNASKANTMYSNAKLLQQWNIDQITDMSMFKTKLLNNLDDIKINAILPKGDARYASMSVAKLRTLTDTHTKRIGKLKEELAAIKQAGGNNKNRIQKKKANLQAQIEAHEQVIDSNTRAIADLEDAINGFAKSQPSSMTSANMTNESYQKLYRDTMDEATELKGNKLFQAATASLTALLVSKLIAPLSSWGRNERNLAKHWYPLFYPHSDMDYATEAVIDIGATLNVIANRVFPQFHINPQAEEMLASRGISAPNSL